MNFLSQYVDQIQNLCGSNKVRTLFAFGSVLRDDFNMDSDIDLVVQIDEPDPFLYSNSYFNLKFQLEHLLNRKVDLLEEQAIINPYVKEQIDQSKVILYGR